MHLTLIECVCLCVCLQSVGDVLQERFAVEMKCNTALRLAALHMHERLDSCGQTRTSIKSITWVIYLFLGHFRVTFRVNCWLLPSIVACVTLSVVGTAIIEICLGWGCSLVPNLLMWWESVFVPLHVCESVSKWIKTSMTHFPKDQSPEWHNVYISSFINTFVCCR